VNHFSDGRMETTDAKISSKRIHFDTHMLNSEVGWIKDGSFILRTEGGGAALLVFNWCRELVPLSR
jgi:hypothetical protein